RRAVLPHRRSEPAGVRGEARPPLPARRHRAEPRRAHPPARPRLRRRYLAVVTPIELLVLSAALQAGSTGIQKQRVATRGPNWSLAGGTGNLGAFFGPLFRDPWWLGGLLLGVAGALTGLQALSAMDLSVIKPLGRVET